MAYDPKTRNFFAGDCWGEFMRYESVVLPDEDCADWRGDNPMEIEHYMEKRCREMSTDELAAAYIDIERFGTVQQKAISAEFWRRAG